MSKKLAYSALFTLTMCLGLVSCGGKSSGDVDLYYAYATENLLSDWDYLQEKGEDEFETEFILEQNRPFIGRDHTLRYHLMQGEHDGMQLMVRPHHYVDTFDFKLPTLKNESGDELSQENLKVSAAWYQEVISSLEKESLAGFYPDALIPLENYKWRRNDHINKDMNQSLYIEVTSTYDTKPGNYKGTGQLLLDDKEYNIPFEVTIYDVKMSNETHWNSSYLIWYEEIVNGERENAGNEMNKIYFDYVVDHRMSPDQLPDDLKSNPQVLADNYYKYIANDPRISSYRMPFAGASFSKESARNYLQALIDKNIEVIEAGDKDCDFFKKIYFYVDDEPSSANYDVVRSHDKDIYDLKNELKDQLKDYPNLVESFTHIENLVTLHFNELLVPTEEQGGIQCWCPQYQHFNTQAQRDKYKERQASKDRQYGENVWWYGCMDPASPYPSNHLDAKLITGRCVPWMQYAYGIEGNIYWNVCYYSKQTQTVKMGRDIWYDPMTWVNCAGDGALLYPGIDYGIKGPIPTLRIESIQAGSEDYEYLYYIGERVNEYNKLNNANLNATEQLQSYFDRIFVNVTPHTDAKEFENVRIEVLKLCETLNKNLNEGIELLQNGR